MNSSFQNRWSFSYLKFTKYVTNIIAEPKYKYGQQEQVTVRNHTEVPPWNGQYKNTGGPTFLQDSSFGQSCNFCLSLETFSCCISYRLVQMGDHGVRIRILIYQVRHNDVGTYKIPELLSHNFLSTPIFVLTRSENRRYFSKVFASFHIFVFLFSTDPSFTTVVGAHP